MKKTRDVEAVVIVRCVSCLRTREIRAGEIAPDDLPMCQHCWSPMVAESARLVTKP